MTQTWRPESRVPRLSTRADYSAAWSRDTGAGCEMIPTLCCRSRAARRASRFSRIL